MWRWRRRKASLVTECAIENCHVVIIDATKNAVVYVMFIGAYYVWNIYGLWL